MSRSPYHPSTREAGLPYNSSLNAAATPFSFPFTPIMSAGALSPFVSPRSALRLSAPAFVTPVATMVTPQSSDEHVTETSGASFFEQSLDHEGSASMNGVAAGEFNCDFTNFDFGHGDFTESNQFNFGQVTDDNQGFECGTLDPTISDDIVVQHSQTVHHEAASISDMVEQHVPGTHHATFDDNMVAKHPRTFHRAAINDALSSQSPYPAYDATLVRDMALHHEPATGNAAALNEHMYIQDLGEVYDTVMNGDMFVQHPQAAHDAVINDDKYVQHLPILHNAAVHGKIPVQHLQATHRAAPIGHIAVQHPHTSLPKDRLEHAQWNGDAYVMGQRYIHRSIEDDFDLTFVNTTGAYDVDHSTYPTPPLSYGISSPEDDVRTESEDDGDTVDAEYNEDVDGEGETDDEYHPVRDTATPSTKLNKKAGKAAVTSNKKNTRSAAKQVTEDTASVVEEVLESTFAVKQRKANVVIARQNAQPTLERRLGQQVRVSYTAAGVIDIGGIYWKAPANDASIPRTLQEKFACVQAIIAAIRNNKDCKEVDTTKTFLNRWADGATYFSPEELEFAAWKIVVSHLFPHTSTFPTH
jgi:hypothetical protein